MIRLDRLQPLGRALMLPIAVLPVAGLLLRLGQPDMLDVAFIAAAGQAIFANLGLMFAIGVAIGIARENHGAAGLAGVVAFLVTTEGGKALLAAPIDQVGDIAVAAWKAKEMGKLSVPAGILSGLASGWLYNRYATIKVPEYLAFFGGRRFVPIAAGLAGLIGALVFGLGFPVLEAGIDIVSRWVLAAGPVGLFLYGVLNRLLIVTGLHHILNNIAWFILGDFGGKTGDLNRFFAGDPSAGSFMAGFFPVMMFGLPAACLAMYRAAPPERRKGVAGLYLSLGLTSLLTGVTEPIEFTFMFLAPVLYAIHAVLTGLSMVIMNMLGVKLGFGFSAGLFDYLLNYGLATRPLLLLPVGAVYFAVYYYIFRFCISRFNLLTPGRESEAAGPSEVLAGGRGAAFARALGGRPNLSTIDACTTRLRLTVRDRAAVDEGALKKLGARGVLWVGDLGLQVVLGPIADQVASEIRSAAIESDTPPTALIAALGGQKNVDTSQERQGRLRIKVFDPAAIDAHALTDLAPRGWTMAESSVVHILR